MSTSLEFGELFPLDRPLIVLTTGIAAHIQAFRLLSCCIAMAELEDVKLGSITSDDVVIAVMGPTGAGKSTFIDVATEQGGMTVGHSLEACTSHVRAVRVPHPKDGRFVVFVDTPGFNNTRNPNAEISDWLINMNKNNIRLAGIIYLHRISDNRVAASPLKNLRMFAHLCGGDAVRNVILATTMWTRVTEHVGSQREKELREHHWKEMLDHGSDTARFDRTFDCAWRMVDRFLMSRTVPTPQVAPPTKPQSPGEPISTQPFSSDPVQNLELTSSRSGYPSPDNPSTDSKRSYTKEPKRLFYTFLKTIGRQESRRKSSRPTSTNSVVPVKNEDFFEEELVIAVIGPAGTTKSSFINTVTGYHCDVGHGLQPCTTDIEIVRFQCLDRSDFDIVFVDTPGFDSSENNKTDVEVLNTIALWLKSNYQRKVTLAGILYFHRISDNRFTETPFKNLRMFQELCGKDGLQNIILTTTMWDEVDEETGSQREKELKGKHWKAMMDQGSQILHYDGTSDSAWSVLNSLLQSRNERYAVLLREEMAQLGMQVQDTAVGTALFSTTENLVKSQQDMIHKIREETRRRGNDQTLRALKDRYEAVRKELEKAVTEMQTLNIPPGKCLLRTSKATLKRERQRSVATTSEVMQ